LILKHLVKRFRGLGGELLLRKGVKTIHVENEQAVCVELDNGEQLTAKPDPRLAGQLTFIESISVLDREPSSIGNDDTIVFYNDSEKFHWERPADELCDTRTGVVCSPNNYVYTDDEGKLADGVVRITTIADYDRWAGLSEEEYQREKLRWYDRSVAASVKYTPDFRPYVIDTDLFTPTTINRFTWHDNGADQGFVGIIGAMMSGISMANMHCLRA